MKMPFTGRRRAGPPSPLAQDPAEETKSATPLVAVELSRRACFTAGDLGSLCREGYARNPVVYRCVRLIAESAASVPLRGDALPGGTPEALERFYGYLQVAGEAYLHAARIGEDVIGVSALRPDAVEVLTDRAGRPAGYAVTTPVGRTAHRRDALTGTCDVMRLALFNPLSDTAAQSPLRAASTSVDLHNQGTRWAKALLDNSARPSGALVCKGGSSGLSASQVSSLKAELESHFSGPVNAGRPMVLEGGLDWTSMGLSPSDMDFAQGRREAARDIALAFGVPPILLGIPGDNTYANYAEANRAFWRQTVMPLVARTAAALSDWLGAFGPDVAVLPDFDAVPALAPERAALWAKLEAASFLDEDEKRALAGLPMRGTLQ